MNNRERIYQSLNLMEENLKSNMNVYNISQELGFSFYYFSRLFKAITGLSPKTYLLNRKITQSIKDVCNKKTKIIDIAFKYGFSTPESFSRAFQKVTGYNPSNLRKTGKIDKAKLQTPLTKEKLENYNIINRIEPELVETGPICLVGIPFYYKFKWQEDLSKPWQNLIDHVSFIKNRIKPERYFQVQYWFANQSGDSIFFFLAVETSTIDNIPIQFTAKVLPKQKYLKFFHKGLSNRVGYTYQFIYENWLLESDYQLPHLYNFEFYGDQYLGPYNEESISEIYIPIEI
ncbi:MAG: AraC family transcriptional regulator [Spirochaetes bacterium]|nr:AraC family transcriptional regulator [Spirochaetota bacterium]